MATKTFTVTFELNAKDNWDGWRPVIVLTNPESGYSGMYVEGQMEDSSDKEFFEETGKTPYIVFDADPLKDESGGEA